MILLRKASQPREFELGVALFKEYAAQIDIDLSFQNFAQELKTIDTQYGPPFGCLILVYHEKDVIGCFGIRRLDPAIGELKRMFIRPQFRNQGIGKIMLQKAIKMGTELGYKKLRLDTLPSMKAATNLYQSLGFYEIEAYRDNPFRGAKYFQKDL